MKRWSFFIAILFHFSTSVGWTTETPPKSAEESLDLFSVDDGYAVELVAAEPLVMDPVGIDWGFDGKLWVVEMADYPYGVDGEGKAGGRVRFLTDTDGDGRMDESTLFLEGLSFPTGVMAWGKGVLVTAPPDILYAEDTDGDGVADKREVLFSGFMQGNQQLRLNGLRYGLDNWVHCASGGHHVGFGAQNQIRVVSSGLEVALGSGDLRFQPKTHEIERLAGPSQFGRVRDDWGNWFGVQNSYPIWHYALEDRYLKRNPHVTTPDPRQQLRGQQPEVFANKPPQKRFHGFDHVGRYTSACGPSIYRDEWLFPREEGLTHAFTCEPFSNLVQHHHLVKAGVSFAGKRAESSSKTDFLASADRWCRPVMTRTGPDGALWIVDVYRYMIEHPDWLPEVGREELKPFYRFGENRGRIYRVVKKDQKRKAIPELAKASAESLVPHLADANGVVRDAAQRLLVDGGALLARPTLEAMTRHELPQARLQALATLSSAELGADIVSAALRDPHAAIRRFAVSFASTEDLVRFVEDSDAEVRLQLAYELGERSGEMAGAALIELAKQEAIDDFTMAAILSSAPKHYHQMASAADQLRSNERLLKGLLSMAPAYQDDQPTLLRGIFGRKDPEWSALEFRLLAHWLNLSNGEVSPAVSPMFMQARRLSLDVSQSEDLRCDALGIFGHLDDVWVKEASILETFLDPQQSLKIQSTAVEVLRQSRRPNAAQILLGKWPSLSPSLRSSVLDALLESEAAALVAHLKKGALTNRDFNAGQRERLLKRVPEAAEFLQAPPRREEAMKQRAGALRLTGDVSHGREVFVQSCAICHQIGDVGKQIGPDLRALTNRSTEAVYAAILDPNRAVEPLYMAYTATAGDDDVVYGILKSETGNTLTFQLLDGSERQLLRANLKTLESAQTSLMPEGLEAGLSDQALADVIAFVQTLK
ncbi:MAG: putative membrane-bound dehydrogenase-like protein [Verrucomicrobiales bacterium]|jgi:putative membrane-bound dehydrogenase-like protein